MFLQSGGDEGSQPGTGTYRALAAHSIVCGTVEEFSEKGCVCSENVSVLGCLSVLQPIALPGKLLTLITSFYTSLAVSANSGLDVYLTDLFFEGSCLLPKVHGVCASHLHRNVQCIPQPITGWVRSFRAFLSEVNISFLLLTENYPHNMISISISF